MEIQIFLKKIEIRRISIDQIGDASKASTRLYEVDLTQKEAADFDLQSRDLVRINYVENWNPDDYVVVEGEVKFPGEYAVRAGETIGSILERAGGFTEQAFPQAYLVVDYLN